MSTPTATPALPDFASFQRDALAHGYDEVVAREWAPRQELATHGHPFAVQALVVRGEMWLTVGHTTRHLRPGDRFQLASDEQHAERYGTEGATYWVARRHGPKARARAEDEAED